MLAFENDLRLNENILRHGAFRQDEVPIKPILPLAQTPSHAVETPQPDLEDEADDVDVEAVLGEPIDPELIPAAED
jgi:hypothetical protein